MATLTILFTSRARREMREILDFISQDNPSAASKLAGQIMQSIDHKATFPKAGRIIPEAPEHLARERVLPPCRIFYIADHTNLHVLSIMRSERLFQLQQIEN